MNIDFSAEQRTRLERLYAEHNIPDEADRRLDFLRKKYHYGTIYCEQIQDLTKEQIEERKLRALELIVVTFHLSEQISERASEPAAI